MKTTHYLTATVQQDHRLEINLPELSEGQNVEVILIVNDNNFVDESNKNLSKSTNNINNIMKKSLAERRQMMLEQAKVLKEHYEQDKSWQEWENIDLGSIYDY